MSLLIDDLATWLAGKGEGTVGTDIFKVTRPSYPIACVSLQLEGSWPPDLYVPREFPVIKVTARAANSHDAQVKAYSLFNRLHRLQGERMGGTFVLTSDALDSPEPAGTEGAAASAREGAPLVNAHLVSFNVVFDLRRSSS